MRQAAFAAAEGQVAFAKLLVEGVGVPTSLRALYDDASSEILPSSLRLKVKASSVQAAPESK